MQAKTQKNKTKTNKKVKHQKNTEISRGNGCENDRANIYKISKKTRKSFKNYTFP